MVTTRAKKTAQAQRNGASASNRQPNTAQAQRNGASASNGQTKSKSGLGNYQEIFWDSDKPGKEQLIVRCKCGSDEVSVVKDCLLQSLVEDDVDVSNEEVLDQLHVGLYLGVCEVPSGLVCNSCVLKHPHKTKIYQSQKALFRHLRNYNDKIRTTEDLQLLKGYNPKGGRKRVYCGTGEEIRESKKARRKENQQKKRQEDVETKKLLANAKLQIELLRRSNHILALRNASQTDPKILAVLEDDGKFSQSKLLFTH